MKYEKPTVEIIRFDNFKNIMTSSAGVPPTCSFYGTVLDKDGVFFTCYDVHPTGSYDRTGPVPYAIYECRDVSPRELVPTREVLICISVNTPW